MQHPESARRAPRLRRGWGGALRALPYGGLRPPALRAFPSLGPAHPNYTICILGNNYPI